MRKLMILPATAALALAACGSKPEPAQPTQPTLHDVMLNQIDANADKLWEVTNAALGENAEIVPAKMDDEKWAETVKLAEAVAAGAKQIEAMKDPITVAAPGVKISDEGVHGHSAAEVQANVDKDPASLREMAGALAQHMSDLAAAARIKDAARVGPLVDQLDGVCEDCHLEFWYPDQKALVEKYRNEGVAPAAK